MSDTLAVFFLCAGYGQRLRPLTDRIPKPALSFQGKTALEINYRMVQPLHPNRVLCNTHHLFEKMEKPARRLGMSTLYEADILGTGGCIANARHILETTDRFLAHNGDLIHTIDLKELFAKHRASGHIATLAGVFRPIHNTLSVNQEGNLLGVHGFENFQAGEREISRLTFAGIAIYEKAFLNFVKPGCEDIKPYWNSAIRAGHSIGIVNCSHDAVWFDFGTPQGLWEAAKFMMETNKDFSFHYAPAMSEHNPYVANEADLDRLPEALRNVVIYEEPAATISDHTKDLIIGRDFRWRIIP